METLGQGAMGAIVDLLQLGLKRAGWFEGGIDGIYGDITRQAVLNFQKYQDLQETGDADTETWEVLTPWLTGAIRIVLQKGDTLWKLANSYGTTITAIQTANPSIRPEQLRIGQTVVIPLGFDVVATNIRYSSDAVAFFITGLLERYPFLKRESIGKSVIGKNLDVLEIGRGPTEVFYNAAHHANEWLTTPLLLKFLENYAKAYVSNNKIGGYPARVLFRQTRMFIAPLVDPDGVDLVTGALPRNAYYEFARILSTSYPSIPFPDGWKANIRGVDLNLQYPAGWEEAREIKFNQGFRTPGPRDFVGSAPLSEPESAAVFFFTQRHNFALTLSYHSQGEVIYWKFKDYLPAGSWEIAQIFADMTGYTAEETPSESGNAGYKDWFIQDFDRPGYTFEVGRGVNPLPLSQFDQIYAENEPVLALGAKTLSILKSI